MFNLAEVQFSKEEFVVLKEGLQYAPSTFLDKFELFIDMEKFSRKLNIFFNENTYKEKITTFLTENLLLINMLKFLKRNGTRQNKILEIEKY